MARLELQVASRSRITGLATSGFVLRGSWHQGCGHVAGVYTDRATKAPK
jgi:hypothetical protein